MRRKPLLIALVPARPPKPGDPPAPALEGRSGRNLARIADLPYEILMALTTRINLYPAYPGEDRAPDREELATEAALMLKSRTMMDREVAFLGKAVAEAFGIRQWGSQIFTSRLLDTSFGRTAIWLLPHPSGLCHVWNDPEARRRGKTVIRKMLEGWLEPELRGQKC